MKLVVKEALVLSLIALGVLIQNYSLPVNGDAREPNIRDQNLSNINNYSRKSNNISTGIETNKLNKTVQARLVVTNDIFHANYHQLNDDYSFESPSGQSQNSDLLDNKDDKINSSPHGSPKESLSHQAPLNPVILVPGDGGSRLQAKLDRQQVSHHYCERKSNDWFDLWLNLSLLVPFAIDCWLENMKMDYNITTRSSSNAPGVNIRVQGFGSSDSVEFVDPARVYGTSYFETIVKTLTEMGYERDKNILGAPYDFRRAPNELQDYFRDLNDLVEIAYRVNDNQRVVLICHSMGCLNSLYFLHSKSQAWKDTHIKSLISLSGVWGGSVKAMKAFASGDNFGVVVIPSLSLRKDIRTFPSLAYLLPSADVWPANEVLLKHRNRNYTVNDYKEFFEAIKYPIGYEIWKDVRNLTSTRRPPGVEIHCLHGHKVTTMDKLEYLSGEFPDTARLRLIHGDGDGTVNRRSLEVCDNWKSMQEQTVNHQTFPNIDHMAILSDHKVMQYITETLERK